SLQIDKSQNVLWHKSPISFYMGLSRFLFLCKTNNLCQNIFFLALSTHCTWDFRSIKPHKGDEILDMEKKSNQNYAAAAGGECNEK
ncbi:hypothetical protein DERF_007263, partial [Dermatophagoides farinae]